MQPLEAAVFATIYPSLNHYPERAFPYRFQWCMCFPSKMKKCIRLFAGFGLLLLAFCGYDPQPIAAVPEAKEFWQVFIEANESGSREQFLNFPAFHIFVIFVPFVAGICFHGR